MNSVLIGVWCMLLGVSVLDAQDNCTTPTGVDGQCISIKDCDKLRLLIQSNPEQRDQLTSKWNCGYVGVTPMVCCPKKTSNDKCVTFSGQSGTCKSLDSCPFLLKKLEEKPVSAANLEYVQRSRCDRNRENYFCCYEVETDTRLGENTLLPDRKSRLCGIESASKDKIINGAETGIEAYPWMGVIEYTESGRPYLCAGSLINDRYVLTAAHCLVTSQNVSLGAGSVRFGDYNITNDGPDCIDTAGGGRDCTNGDVSIKIESIIVHPEYDNSKELLNVNDIALIRLMTPAPYNEFIRPICLPETDITTLSPSNLTMVIAGWGYVNDTNVSDVKMEANIDLVDRETCIKKYSRGGGKSFIGSSQLCAGGGAGGQDVCGGDSGGPLSFFQENVQEIVGVISFGPKQCAIVDRPSVYTKVYDYLNWITSNVKP